MSDAQQRVEIARDATERLLAQNDRANRTKNRLIAAIGMIVIVLLTIFGALTVSQQASVNARLLHASKIREEQNQSIANILNDVRQTVDPQSALSRRNTAEVKQLVIQIEECIYRHEDRLVEAAQGQPLMPAIPGCPVEGR